MRQEIEYYANIKIKSQGCLSFITDNLNKEFDVEISNIKILDAKTNYYSFDIKIKTAVHPSLKKHQITRELYRDILQIVFFEELKLVRLVEEAEIYNLDN